MKLSDTINKPIAHFCSNGYTNSKTSHCAHFVCHVLEIGNGQTCEGLSNGRNPGSSVRVHELFTYCPQVGLWADAPQGPCLVFVTDRSNVNLAKHTMTNIPKKHVGLFSDGLIYNYANLLDKVVAQDPASFLKRFDNTYGGDQALFYGVLPPGARLPTPENMLESLAPMFVPVPAAGPELTFRRDGKDHFATMNGGNEFFIGHEGGIKKSRYLGLYQPRPDGPKFSSDDYVGSYGTYAAILEVISAGESAKYFNRLNTYDRAAFTFGVFQLAAHTPSDNLVLLFRRLVVESQPFQELFPDLRIVEGKLHRVVGTHTVSLENEYPRPEKPKELILKDFMKYLNSDGAEIDNAELTAAARLIYLANNDPTFNGVQVDLTAQIVMRRMQNQYGVAYKLDGVSDLICAAIADIHHQSRGTQSEIRSALTGSSSDSEQIDALCRIGISKYSERCKTLSAELKAAKSAGRLGRTFYDKASGLFRPKSGWPT